MKIDGETFSQRQVDRARALLAAETPEERGAIRAEGSSDWQRLYRTRRAAQVVKGRA